MLLLQISDPHIRPRGELLEGRVDTAAGLTHAIQGIDATGLRPDVVVLSGDLVNDAREPEYEHLAELLGELSVPIIFVMGNHDDRALMRRYLTVPDHAGIDVDPVQYVVDLDAEHRIIVLDTTQPGAHGGLLDVERLEWLDRALNDSRDRSVIIVQHHPPIESGIGFMDQYGLDGADEEAAILSSYSHVAAVLCGHLHRPLMSSVAGVPVVVSPSSAAQVALDLGGGPTAYTDEPGMVTWHRWSDRAVASHFAQAGASTRWVPSWAMTTDAVDSQL